MAAALTALVGVLGVQAYHAHQAAQLRALYLQVGRQGALNLTTIDWHHADADVRRILDSATGTFYEDFSQRSGPFVEVVKKVESISTGTVTVGGLESFLPIAAELNGAVDLTKQSPGDPYAPDLQPPSRPVRPDIGAELLSAQVLPSVSALEAGANSRPPQLISVE